MGSARRRPDLAWIALLALAMQLAASFGHVHLDDDEEEHETEQAIALACEPHSQHSCRPAAHHDHRTCAILLDDRHRSGLRRAGAARVVLARPHSKGIRAEQVAVAFSRRHPVQFSGPRTSSFRKHLASRLVRQRSQGF